MSLSQVEYLKHIRDEIEYLITHSRSLSLNTFLSDNTLQRSFVRSLEIIGEATKKLSADFKSKYPEVEWKVIAGTRDKLIHDYFGVDYELVWDIVTSKIPVLKKQIDNILHHER
jgi:uncharacterized protein with HEPN domain